MVLPPVGGDTCFASMYAAYDALSPAMQDVVDGLGAVHSLEQMVERTKHVANASLRDSLDQWPPVVHPVVRVHPETGRKLLNVNANWTTSIDGFTEAESDALLGFLLGHVKNPEFQCRFHWSEGAVAFWDNRAVQHYAVADYTVAARHGAGHHRRGPAVRASRTIGAGPLRGRAPTASARRRGETRLAGADGEETHALGPAGEAVGVPGLDHHGVVGPQGGTAVEDGAPPSRTTMSSSWSWTWGGTVNPAGMTLWFMKKPDSPVAMRF